MKRDEQRSVDLPIKSSESERQSDMSKDSTGNTTLIDQTDWARVAHLRDEDIAVDADNPVTSLDDWDGAVMKVGAQVVGTARTRGRQKAPKKLPVTIRLSPEVVEYFKSTGDGWQTRLDMILREYVKAH